MFSICVNIIRIFFLLKTILIVNSEVLSQVVIPIQYNNLTSLNLHSNNESTILNKTDNASRNYSLGTGDERKVQNKTINEPITPHAFQRDTTLDNKVFNVLNHNVTLNTTTITTTPTTITTIRFQNKTVYNKNYSGNFSKNSQGSLMNHAHINNQTLNSNKTLTLNKPMFGTISLTDQTKLFRNNNTISNLTLLHRYNNLVTVGIPRNITGKNNLTVAADPLFNPTRWLLKVQAPWKHVSDKSSLNETSVVQVCKFEKTKAICSAEYSSSSFYEKLWIQLVESEGKAGIDVSAFEHGHVPRVIFKNRVNGTICQRFTNGTFHQICVKIYGYDRALGPTRMCLQLGAAIFNHGVASTDFKCFRFSSDVRHEDSMDGESPNPSILNRYILANNYSNIIESSLSNLNSHSVSIKSFSLFLAILLTIFSSFISL